MEYRHLKLIKAIAEEGSITKAIDKLHLTQSALSYQLKEAEYQLGTKIFHRSNKRMVLTQAGEKLYELANEMIEKMQQTEKQIKKLIFGEAGEIRISTECYSSYHWLPALMKQFRSIYPNIGIQIVVEATHSPLQGLLNGSLDIAITTDPIKNDNIKYVELFQDEIVAIVPETHEWATRRFVNAQDFSIEHLIIHSYPLESVTVHQYVLAPAKVSPAKITAMPLTEATLEMVKADLGIAVMARWILQSYLHQSTLKTVKIGKNGLKRKHYAAVMKNREYPDYFANFIEFLQREIYLK